jgi:hypothetical protein
MPSNQSIARALQSLVPGAEWSVHDGDLKQLIWHDKKIQRPTDDQIQAAIAAYVPPSKPAPIQDQLTALQAQVEALMAVLDKNKGAQNVSIT